MHLATFTDQDDGLFRAWDIDQTPDGIEICEIMEMQGAPVPPSRVVLPAEQAVRMAWAILGQKELAI